MLAAADGDLWLMSTPWAKRGFFYEAGRRAGRSGSGERAGDGVPADFGEFLEGERQSMGERGFRREYMCEFSESEEAVFREEDIEAALDWGLQPLGIYRSQECRSRESGVRDGKA